MCFWKKGIRAELASRADISQSNLSEILHRTRGVSIERAELLSDLCENYLGVSVPPLAWVRNRKTLHKAFFGKPLKS